MRDPVLKALQTRAERIDTAVNGVQQTWHVWNRSHPQPLVLLHGGSGSWTHWVRNIDALSQQHAVVGHGFARHGRLCATARRQRRR